jgi:translation initiation factor IF-1
MPKNLRGGKHKHMKNHIIDNDDEHIDVSQTILKVDESNPNLAYGIILKNFGSALEVGCANGKTCRVSFPNKFKRKGIFLNKDDIVLFERTELKNGNYVVCKYDANEKEYLKSLGELKFLENMNSNTIGNDDANDDTGFNFDDI